MRGKILQYNGNDGTGIVVVDGQQHKFAIASWKSETAPAVGKTVEVVVADGAVASLTLVGEDVLLREKTAELTGKLGHLVGEMGSGLSKAGSSGAAASVIGKLGRPVLVAYGVFLLGTLAFHFISMQMLGQKQGASLWDLSSLMNQMGGGGSGVKFLLLLGYVSIGVPFVWPDKRGWLAFLLPLVAVIWGWWSVRNATSGAPGMGDLFSYGLGCYLAVLSALVIAAGGVKNFLAGGA
jgi:hypothetical protein